MYLMNVTNHFNLFSESRRFPFFAQGKIQVNVAVDLNLMVNRISWNIDIHISVEYHVKTVYKP